MMGSDEICEIQNIIMVSFRYARSYHNLEEMSRYRDLHRYFHEHLGYALNLELMEEDLARYCDGGQE